MTDLKKLLFVAAAVVVGNFAYSKIVAKIAA
jgi:hypothetical protein